MIPPKEKILLQGNSVKSASIILDSKVSNLRFAKMLVSCDKCPPHDNRHHEYLSSGCIGSSQDLRLPVLGSPALGSPVLGSPGHGSPVHGSPVLASPVHGSPVLRSSRLE